MLRRLEYITVYLVAVFFVQMESVKAQFTITGTTFRERCDALIECMVNDIQPYGKNSTSIKYTTPFYWARIYQGVDVENSIAELERIYDYWLTDPSTVYLSGSDVDFSDHMTMHGYLLTKDKLPDSLKDKVKRFLQLSDFNTYGTGTSTLNMDMMHYTAGLLAAQEWSDFTDVAGRTAENIINYNRPRILNVLDNIFHNNCSEMDAFVYLPTDFMYIRMLAEYCTDSEVNRKAKVVYQQMIAAMIGAWNQELYVANPPRSKGWEQLVGGPLGMNSRITMLAWLFFGNPSNSIKMADQCMSDTNNSASFCFWVAYKGRVVPLPAILNAEKRKTYPYEYTSFIDNITVSKTNTMTKNWKQYKYTWQSQNYGLATQTEIPYNLTKAPSTYAYKEIKRTYLVWRDETTDKCFFTVCQDNPERPTDAVNANAVGYGENPYHRVLQYKGTAIGITNVPTTYLKDNRYRMYVPFTNEGIKARHDKEWIFCHTGSMMFAFRTVEPFTMGGRLPFSVPGCTVLMFNPTTTHKGAWILETTEITEDLKGADMDEELDKFEAKLLANSKIETLDYSTDYPRLQYTSMSGDVLDLTYFPPTSTYSGQYKINGITQSLNTSLFSSPYAVQEDKSEDVYIYDTEETPTKLSWGDDILGMEKVHPEVNIRYRVSGGYLYVSGIESTTPAQISIFEKTGTLICNKQVFSEADSSVNVANFASGIYLLRVQSSNYCWVTKFVK